MVFGGSHPQNEETCLWCLHFPKFGMLGLWQSKIEPASGAGTLPGSCYMTRPSETGVITRRCSEI